ncbi:MAG: hypothetical protein KJ930_09675 [Gammaproteobacteria bacterium]|jgi:hypothetical protein|nr:hypothetical protein [Gammaproteobacteria bacterium]MBU2179689.1 hypothetical protein [Gammaproteobacteria bacterium]MBU2223299.1 hypothetical protein [Gammaproteobacteria bacterium]MBU2277666.1 hypothetical protein [Gammaproteobacteria bacterium]MBU2428787.1 hypothetical protein [Gammaproteobacteria bacterium]
MAITFRNETDKALELDEFYRLMDNNLAENSSLQISYHAELLYRLFLNRNLVKQFLLSGLTDEKNFQKDNLYTPDSFIIGEVKPAYYLRLNIWQPESEFDQRSGKSNVYTIPHNHDFSFLTVGYFGAGYQSDVWEIESSNTDLAIGSKVNLVFLERFQLAPGKVVYFRAGKDLHLQYPPEHLSLSLNIMYPPTEKLQIKVDLDSKQIIEHVGRPTSMRREFVRRQIERLHEEVL